MRSLTALVGTESRRLVVKMMSSAEHLAARREVAALNLLAGSRAPVPTLVECSLAPSGVSWLIETELSGVPPPPLTDPGDQFRVYEALGVALGSLHEATAGQGWGDLDGDFGSGLDALVLSRAMESAERARIAATDRREAELVRAAAGVIARLTPAVSEAARQGLPSVLVHRDYGTSNVLLEWRSGRWRVSGIFDFEDAYRADPAEDFKWMAFEGPGSAALGAALSGYVRERDVDETFGQRIGLYTAELALDVASWSGVERSQSFRIMEALLAGWEPAAHTRTPPV